MPLKRNFPKANDFSWKRSAIRLQGLSPRGPHLLFQEAGLVVGSGLRSSGQAGGRGGGREEKRGLCYPLWGARGRCSHSTQTPNTFFNEENGPRSQFAVL